jgi:AcrR family transcriptional regulator
MPVMETMQRQSREEMNRAARDTRKAVLIDAVLDLSTKGRPYHALLRDEIAAHAGVSNGTINHAFDTLDRLRTAAMVKAIERENLTVIAQGLAVGDPAARAAPAGLKERAIRSIV